MTATTWRPIAWVAAFLAACGDGPGPDVPDDCTVGEGEPAIAAVLFRGEGEQVMEAVTGGDIHLVEPPQGGYVVFAGPRLTGMCGEDLRVYGSLTHVESGVVLWEEERLRLDYVDVGGALEPTWSRIVEYPNLLACPTFEAWGVDGERVRLTVRAVDAKGRTAEATVEGVGRCAQADASQRTLCSCVCGADYVPGACSP